MNERIEVKFPYPYWTAYKASLLALLYSPYNIIISAVFPLVGLYAIYLCIKHHHILGPIELLQLSVAIFFTPIVTAFTLFLSRRSNKLSQGVRTYIFDSEGLHVIGDAFNLSVRWLAISRVTELAGFMFFFVAPARAHVIPLEALTSDSLHQLREIVRRYALKSIKLNDRKV